MTQLTQETWDGMTDEQRDKFLRDLVRWPSPHGFPVAFDEVSPEGRVVHSEVAVPVPVPEKIDRS